MRIKASVVVSIAAIIGTVVGGLSVPITEATSDSGSNSLVSSQPEDDEFAVASAKAGKTGDRVRIEAATTPDSLTFANPDGTFTSEISDGPVRVRDESAAAGWRALNLSLVDGEEGVTPLSDAHELVMSNGGQASRGGSQDLVTLAAGDSRVGFGWSSALPTPTLSGNSATYQGVREGVDIVVESQSTGVKQSFILTERPSSDADLSFELAYIGQGSTVTRLSDNSFEIRDIAGELIGSIPTPMMWDSQKSVASGLPITQIPLATEFVEDEKGSRFVIRPDLGFLKDPSTVYPVVLDPTIQVAGGFDTFVRSDFPTTIYNTHAELQVGTYNGGTTKSRSTVHFSAAAWRGTDIVSATLKLYLFHSWSCTAAPFTVYKSSNATSSTNWNSQPTVTSSISASLSTAKGYSASCAAGYVSVPVTNIAKSFASGTASTVAFGLRASESANAGWKRFNSGNAASNKPLLSVDYRVLTDAPVVAIANEIADVDGESFVPASTEFSAESSASATSTEVQVRAGDDLATSTIVGSCTVTAALPTCGLPSPLTPSNSYLALGRSSNGVSWGPWSMPITFIVDDEQAVLNPEVAIEEGPLTVVPDLPEESPIEDVLAASADAELADPASDEFNASEEILEPGQPMPGSGPIPDPEPATTEECWTEDNGDDYCVTASTQQIETWEDDPAEAERSTGSGSLLLPEAAVAAAAIPRVWPSWCNPLGVNATRFGLCSGSGFDVTLVIKPASGPTRTSRVQGQQRMWSQGAPNSAQFYTQYGVKAGIVTGPDADKIRYKFDPTCTNCIVDFEQGNFAINPSANRTWQYGYIQGRSKNLAFGEISVLGIDYPTEYTVEGVTKIRRGQLHSLRCDKALKSLTDPGYSSSVGCVNENRMPVITFVASRWPQSVRHMNSAKAANIVGFTAKKPLHRRYSPTALNTSRAIACPSTLTKPTGYQCDEFPFASTREGAAKKTQALTYSYCQIPGSQLNIGIKFSRCMILGTDNAGSGGYLGSGFKSNRILDGDAFVVKTGL